MQFIFLHHFPGPFRNKENVIPDANKSRIFLKNYYGQTIKKLNAFAETGASNALCDRRPLDKIKHSNAIKVIKLGNNGAKSNCVFCKKRKPEHGSYKLLLEKFSFFPYYVRQNVLQHVRS